MQGGIKAFAFTIGLTWGYLISISFWLPLAVMIVGYWDQITGKRRPV